MHVHDPGTLVPALQQDAGEVFTVVNDHLGQPMELVDAGGRVAWAAWHSGWGTMVEVQRDAGAAEVESPWRLLGQYADTETGLCYTRYRYFDAATARWLSRDPLGIAGGANLQGFDGAPSVEVDPWGLSCKDPAHTSAPLDRGTRKTLFHYTDEVGHQGILSSGLLNASTKAANPKDVRYGNGQYLSDFVPGTKTPAQLSRAFLGQPFQGKRFTHYVEIDVTKLDVVQGRTGVYVIPNDAPLNVANLVVGSGKVENS